VDSHNRLYPDGACISVTSTMETSSRPPTGRNQARMTEATEFHAKAIHRLLEVDP
jgi:hypothetical protein